MISGWLVASLPHLSYSFDRHVLSNVKWIESSKQARTFPTFLLFNSSVISNNCFNRKTVLKTSVNNNLEHLN